MNKDDLEKLIDGETRVRYIPNHANGDPNHPDCETGTVASRYQEIIFVKFDEQLERHGWNGTTAKGCVLDNLELLHGG